MARIQIKIRKFVTVMVINKSQLYNMLWDNCNYLRGKMEVPQYKDYILSMLLIKYISDKSQTKNSLPIAIPDGCHFEDIVFLKGKDNIGDSMNIILNKFREANPNCAELFPHSVDFCDEKKLGKDKDLVNTITDLVSSFQRPELDFSKNKLEDEFIGDAYEFIMKSFTSESDKSKRPYYTPAKISQQFS